MTEGATLIHMALLMGFRVGSMAAKLILKQVVIPAHLGIQQLGA